MDFIRSFLFRHSGKLFTLHLFLVGIFCLVPGVLIHHLELNRNWYWLYLFTLIGFCQNIGLVHELAHRTPNILVARFFHALGGLRYTYAKLLHLDHHRFLGTPLDPDRNGYSEHTLSFRDRLFYLFYIGPLRKYWAPVDLSGTLERATKLTPEEKEKNDHKNQLDLFFLVGLHALLLILLSSAYFWILLCLIIANIFSNLREMTEHGRGQLGTAAYVNIQPSLSGVLFFSTPGFWYHGTHHQFPNIPYWQLPKEIDRIYQTQTPHTLQGLPFFKRSSYLHYLFKGT